MARSDWCYHDNHRRCNLSKRHSKKVSTLRGRPSEAIFRQVNCRILKCSMVNSALPAIVQTPIARLRRDTTTTPVIISVRLTSREWRKIISKALLFTTVDTAINNSFCRRTWCLATIMHNITTRGRSRRSKTTLLWNSSEGCAWSNRESQPIEGCATQKKF